MEAIKIFISDFLLVNLNSLGAVNDTHFIARLFIVFNTAAWNSVTLSGLSIPLHNIQEGSRKQRHLPLRSCDVYIYTHAVYACSLYSQNPVWKWVIPLQWRRNIFAVKINGYHIIDQYHLHINVRIAFWGFFIGSIPLTSFISWQITHIWRLVTTLSGVLTFVFVSLEWAKTEVTEI